MNIELSPLQVALMAESMEKPLSDEEARNNRAWMNLAVEDLNHDGATAVMVIGVTAKQLTISMRNGLEGSVTRKVFLDWLKAAQVALETGATWTVSRH